MADEATAKTHNVIENVKNAITDTKEKITETRRDFAKKTAEAIEGARANENVKKMRDKLWGIVNDIKEK